MRNKIIEWAAYYIHFSKPAFFVKGLIFAHGLVDNAIIDQLILFMISHLRAQFTKYAVPAAATLVNLLELMVAIFYLVVAHLSEACFGHFLMIICTTAAYIATLVLLRVLLTLQGAISTSTRILAILVLGGIAAGQSGRDPLGVFLIYQLKDKPETWSNDDREKATARAKFWWFLVKILGSMVSAFVVAGKDLTESFWVLTAVMGAASLLLLCGKCCGSYNLPERQGSAITVIYKVLKAAIIKRRLKYPNSPTGYFRNEKHELRFPPRHPLMRWIDKAAIGQESNDKNLCPVAEVKKVKRLLSLAPLWQSLAVYSLVQATGNTIFLTQSDGLNLCIANSYRVNIGVFFIIRSMISYATSFLIDSILIPKKTSMIGKQRATFARIGAGMVGSTLFCLIGWRVEIHRSNLFQNDRIDGPPHCFLSQYQLPMSIFRLTPQFIMLGLMDALVDSGLSEFFNNYVGESMRRFEAPFNVWAMRTHRYISISYVVVTSRDWLSASTINAGGLARYFKMLAILSFGSLFPYALVSYLYSRKDVYRREDEADQEHPATDVDFADSIDPTPI